MRKYRVRLPLLVHTDDGTYGQGEVFEKDFSPGDELENLESGLLELVPSKYKVVGETQVHGANPGEEFEAALPLGQEQALLGSHIERVEEPAPKPRKKGGKS